MPNRMQQSKDRLSAGSEKISHARLEAMRTSLLRRLESLPPGLRANRGYANARAMLGSSYIRANLSARMAVLRTAQFMITVLELLPPPPQ